MYLLLANIVAIIHVLVVIALFGGSIAFFTVKKYRGSIWDKLHSALVFVTMGTQIIFLGCPLTLIEQALRSRYNPSITYYGSFTTHYLLKYFGFEVEGMAVTAVMAIIVLTAIASFLVFLTTGKGDE